ncbi:MAG: hypothetical protein Q9218_006093 [Villophora microphyllina]
MRSYKNGAVLSSQTLGPLMEDSYATPYLVIHRADLHDVLLEEAQRLGVSIRLDCQFTHINFSQPSIQLADGGNIIADVILGADGERSASRDTLLGHHSPLFDSGNHVFRITVNIDDVAHHEDLVDLVRPPCLNLWVGPGANAMSYALKRDNLFNVVTTCAHDISTTVQHAPRKVDIEEVRKAFSQWDPKLQALLGIAQECSKWTLFEAPEAASWIHPDGKFALIGDAAHAMLPFLAQGAAMVFEDAGVLGTLLSKIQHRKQIPDILLMYERLRKPRTTALRDRSRAMGKIYAYEDGPLQEERDRQLQNHAPFDGYPNFLADQGFQRLLFGYNAIEEANSAWNIYLKGEQPSTRGCWNANAWH